MKKVKLLMPIMCATAISSCVPYLASCGKTTIAYKVTFSESKYYKHSEESLEEGKYRWKISTTQGYEVKDKDVTIKIGGKQYKNFKLLNELLYIPTGDVTGDVEINVTPRMVCAVNVVDGVATGFKEEATIEQIKAIYGDTLVIPSYVKTIKEKAFVTEDENGDLVTTIPSTITRLTFAKNEKGLTSLENVEDEDAAIGAYSFANSPIEYIDFPFDSWYETEEDGHTFKEYKGHTYDIGEGAFAGSAIKVVKLPHPGYATEDSTIDEDGGVYQYKGWMNGLYKMADNAKSFIKVSGLKHIGNYAFLNCKNLKSLILSPFLDKSYGIGQYAFASYDEQTNGFSASNIEHIDQTGFSILALSNEDSPLQSSYSYLAQLIDQMITNYDILVNFTDQQVVIDVNNIKGTYQVNPYVLYLAEMGNTSHALKHLNFAAKSVNAPDFSENDLKQPYAMTDSRHKWTFTISANSISENLTQKWDVINMYNFKESSIEVKISEIAQDSHTLKAAAGDDNTGLVNVLMPDDLNFTIVSENWTGSKVGLSLQQILKPQEESYRNESYKVVCDATPTAGQSVVLKVIVSSESRDFVSDLQQLTIKFIA